MASNREEKLQMRQRGAATRKIKEVDFGFSMGLGATAEDPSQSASQPGIVPEQPEPPAGTVQADPEPPALPPSNGLPVSPTLRSSQRTPGSARNKLPERPSMFDIPGDDETEPPRSIKRMKLETPNKLPKPSSRLNSTRTRDSPPLQNGTAEREPSHIDEPANPPSETENQQQKPISEQIPEPTLPIEPTDVDQEQSQPTDQRLGVNGEDEQMQDAEEPQANNAIAEYINDEDEESVSKVNGPSPADVPTVEAAQDRRPNDSGDLQVSEPPKKRPRGRPSTAQRSSDQNEEAQPQKQVHRGGSEPLRERRPKSRRSMSARTSRGNDKEVGGTIMASTSAGPRKNTRARRRSSEAVADVSTADGEPEEQQDRVNGAPEPKTVVNREKDPPLQSQPRESKKRKRAGRPKTQAQTQPPQEVQELSQAETAQEPGPQRPEQANEREPTPPDPSPPQERRGRGRPRKSTDTEPDRQSEQVTNEREPARNPPKDHRDRGRPWKSTETEPDSQQPAPPGDQPKRRTRTRGEAVPVTVHRLANAASLGGPIGDADSSADEESADELSTQQKTKLPSRGGVNPADVLGQICRETLEKTLTTLKNGISNETNPSRRSEFVRKRKAVEAYGTELEGRLFDLSEILDSNFVLGVQVKKAKREMMDSRSKLYHLRREREEVALQMDAVRSKHTEDEGARMTRSTINNSLHSLQLALDRSQNRTSADEDSGPSDAGTTAGLEFMLRTVAENTSSKAPGAQGGILNQIKSFNVQLEAAARALEH